MTTQDMLATIAAAIAFAEQSAAPAPATLYEDILSA